MRICLICYARLLNNQFRENKLVSTTDSERQRSKQW
jgi:hypothetical protein